MNACTAACGHCGRCSAADEWDPNDDPEPEPAWCAECGGVRVERDGDCCDSCAVRRQMNDEQEGL